MRCVALALAGNASQKYCVGQPAAPAASVALSAKMTSPKQLVSGVEAVGARADDDAHAVGRRAAADLRDDRRALPHAVDHEARAQLGAVARAQHRGARPDGDGGERRALEHDAATRLEPLARVVDQPLGAHADVEHVGEPHVVAAREAAAHRVELDPDHLVLFLAREHARRDELVHLLPRRVPVLLAPAQLARLEHRHP